MEHTLPANARSAWATYEAMIESKQRHFEYLQYLGQKYEKYGQPTSEEKQRLGRLLREHDAQVTTFKTAVQRLRIVDPGAYAALVGQLSAELKPSRN